MARIGTWDQWGGCLVEWANPNRLGPVEIWCYPDSGTHVVVEHEDGYDNDGLDYDNWTDAKTAFDEIVGRLAKTPNWEAQAEYDERWGTVNGEDPRIAAWRDEW